tara:strand:- start:384 stop:572 length:189 start_codon:yes stop_codon:yes gene_type:complete
LLLTPIVLPEALILLPEPALVANPTKSVVCDYDFVATTTGSVAPNTKSVADKQPNTLKYNDL